MPELHFKGKEFVYNHHLSVPFRPLIPHPDKSIGPPSLAGNLIIHGDNLQALKALLPMYAGKVDCIFIDPPYNTGNEGWSYNDNVNSPMMKEWLSSNPINGDDMLRHDKWCAMMWPRLVLLKELLAESGIIAVTIDENELENLLIIMDEIYRREQRLACAVWLSDPSGGKQKSALRRGHEYVVIYGGGDPSLTKEEATAVSLDLQDQHGPYAKGREFLKWGSNSLRKDRETMFFPIRAPDGTEVRPIRNDGKEGRWRLGESNKEMKALLGDPEAAHWERRPFDRNITVGGQTERWVPYEKLRTETRVFGRSTWLENLATNADGTRVIKDIFGEKAFPTPKPVALIEWIISLVFDDNALILDSFAGSWTTAHAVLQQNEKDGGTRQFILVEEEEYADSITAERVRRVIDGYKYVGSEKKELLKERITWTRLKGAAHLLASISKIEDSEGTQYDIIRKEIKDGTLTVTGERKITESVPGLGGSFTYCTLGDPLNLDKILTGESLPDYITLGAWLFHTATGEVFSPAAADESTMFLGESRQYYCWLVYKPNLEFLKSPEAALTLSLAEQISASRPKGKKHLVFAPAKYVPLSKLLPMNIEFQPLPFALYRIEKA